MSDFLKCIPIPELFSLFFVVVLLVAAYIFYRVLLFAFRKMLRKDGIWKKLVESLRYPVLLIFLLVAIVISANVLEIPKYFEEFVEHTITVLIIASIGWVLAGIIRAFYRNFLEKIGDETEADAQVRTMLTQVLFLYRLVMFGVIVITIAAILMTFPYIKSVGVGILGSAGIAGIALGIAARPILLNLMAGFQIAATKTIKIGDAVLVEGDFARVEAIQLTHVVARTWDLRRIILPISYFIDHPFQNWDAKDRALLGSVYLYCDYTVPLEVIRAKAKELIESHPNWNRQVWKAHMTNCTDKTVEIRIIAGANDASLAFELRAFVREKMIEFLQKEYPHALPCVRYREEVTEQK